MAIFRAIQTQQYRDKVARYKIGLVSGCQLKDAVLGRGWLKTEGGIEVPDTSQIPTANPIKSVPNQFKYMPFCNDSAAMIALAMRSSVVAAGDSFLLRRVQHP